MLSFVLRSRQFDTQEQFARNRFIGRRCTDLPCDQRVVFETDFKIDAGRIDLVCDEMAKLKAPVSPGVESNLHGCLAQTAQPQCRPAGQLNTELFERQFEVATANILLPLEGEQLVDGKVEKLTQYRKKYNDKRL